jgi:regulator of sirC expression with transglutaminase-like and TPR domain
MVASCYRRSGDYSAALEKYKWIHQHFPDDTDCKRFKNRIFHSFLYKRMTDEFSE